MDVLFLCQGGTGRRREPLDHGPGVRARHPGDNRRGDAAAQQAGAIIAARSRIVEGAVGMVEMALQMLSHRGVVTLDEERKAAMVSNLLVVLRDALRRTGRVAREPAPDEPEPRS